MRSASLLPLLLLCVLWPISCVGERARGAPKSLAHALHLKGRSLGNPPTGSPQYSYQTKYFTQFLDHFNFHDSTRTFQQRYLINTDSWQVPTAANNYTAGPMFFYTGNEGGIDLFASNTGFVWEIAPQFNAMVVFAEHRYYGETMPFGNQTYKSTDNLQFLTSEQALADFAVLINALKAEYLPPQSNGVMPVIAFGGSYGGMLTAWFRIKYPHVVIGGIAASAPIWQLEGLVSDEIFSEICTRDFTLYGDACPKGIRKSWDILEQWSTTPLGIAKINSIFKPCQPITSTANVTGPLFAFIESALTYMPMVNYPYPASFLGPMPAWPCQAACAFFSSGQSDDDTVVALKNAINVFYNYTGEAGACFNLGDAGPDTLGDLGGWNYQSCTEMVMPIGQNGVNDVFYPAPWNLSSIIAGCQSTYGITPRPSWVATEYGGWDLARSGASNIVFSNGDMDPWSGGGVLTNQSDSLIAVMIANGAHHLDLRESNPLDPPSVIAARQVHIASITKWIQEYRSQSSTVLPQPCGDCPACECTKARFSTVKIVLISCFTTAGAVAAVGLCFYFFINDAKKKKESMRNQAAHTDQRAEATPIAVGRTGPYSNLDDDM